MKIWIRLLVFLIHLFTVAAADTEFESRVLSRGSLAGSYQAFPDVCRLANGDLICVFYAGYGHVSLPREDWPRGGRICLVRSEDEGKTWSAPRVLFDGPDDDRDPHVAQMRDGTVVCSFFPYRQPNGGKPEYETCIVVSKDGGWSWEKTPRILARGWAVSAPVRELRDGTRLLGIYHEEGMTAYGGVLRSTDQGKSWSNPIPIDQNSGVRLDAETDLIQRLDGQVFAALRGDKTNMHFSTSADLGLTWSKVQDIGFPGHSPHLTRLTSGVIVLSHRFPYTALHISRDDGKTWKGPVVIDRYGGAYPSTVELRDGSVLVVYYEEGQGSCIRARRFRVGADEVIWQTLGVEPREIGSRVEPFVDRFLIDRMEGCSLRLHTPLAREVVLKFNAPWEGAFSGYITVLKDRDLFRMYYRGLPIAGRDGSSDEVTCYAESLDGVNWVKPALGLFEIGGSRSNNVVLAGHAPFSHNFAPFIDQRPGVAAEQRFKALAGTTETGLHAFASSDGVRWKNLSQGPVLTNGAFDSQNVSFWSATENCYLMYLRTWTGGGFEGYRTISRSTSTDFLHWTPPEPMIFGEAPLEHLYTSQTQPYFRAPHLLIATPMRFLPGKQILSPEQARALGVEPGYAGDVAEAALMTSRGGTRYQRTFLEGFIRPGLDLGNWASRAGLTALGIVPTGPLEMSIYKQAHYAQASGHLIRYSLRTDGLSSVNAPFVGGEFLTHPLRFTGSQLRLNFSTGAAGFIQMEVLDASESGVAGKVLLQSRELVGDDVDRKVDWLGRSDLQSLEGIPIRLRFVMKDADLYALQFR